MMRRFCSILRQVCGVRKTLGRNGFSPNKRLSRRAWSQKPLISAAKPLISGAKLLLK